MAFTKDSRVTVHFCRCKDLSILNMSFERIFTYSFQCAILAGAVIGSFSWNTVANSYWLASAFWYCCLVLAISGILTSAQQITVLSIMDKIPHKIDSPDAIDSIRHFLPIFLTEIQPPPIGTEAELSINRIGIWRPKWKMIFLWQYPQMLMSYSVILFLAGLTVLVCTPLIKKQPWGPESNVSFNPVPPSRYGNPQLTWANRQPSYS